MPARIIAAYRLLEDRLRLYWSHCGSTRATRWQRLGVPKVETTDDLRKLSEEVLERGFTAIKTNLFPVSPGKRRPLDCEGPSP